MQNFGQRSRERIFARTVRWSCAELKKCNDVLRVYQPFKKGGMRGLVLDIRPRIER